MENLNTIYINKFLASNNKEKNINIQKEKENLEIIIQNQKKYVNTLKNEIFQYEKQLISKYNYINDLKNKIE